MMPCADIVDIYQWSTTDSARAYDCVRSIAAEAMALPSERIRLSRPRGGAPRIDIADCPIRFSISHCQARLVLAVTLSRAIGVDIEPCDRCVNTEAIAKYFMSDDERRQYHELAPAMRHARWLQWWTRKEALAKATGLGLALPWHEHPLPLSPPLATMIADGPDVTYRIADLDLGVDYVASLACRTEASFTARLVSLAPGFQ